MRSEPIDFEFVVGDFVLDSSPGDARWWASKKVVSDERRRITGIGVYDVVTRKQLDFHQAKANQYLSLTIRVAAKLWWQGPLNSSRRVMRAIPVEAGDHVDVDVCYHGPADILLSLVATQVILVEDGKLLTDDEIAEGAPLRV